jgi:hypothetical protein
MENIVTNISSGVACISVAAEICLPSRCLAMDTFSGFTVPAFTRYVAVFNVRTGHHISEDSIIYSDKF